MVLKTERKLCVCCMTEHDVQTVMVPGTNIFKGFPVEYQAEYFYCDRADEYFADEQQMAANDINMKDAYRENVGLLTSRQIAAIRAKYEISQSDLCRLLGWGAKTVTRYEGHQVQDAAHDAILRKLDSDPEWFLELLQAEKGALPAPAYEKYLAAGTVLFEKEHDVYLERAIMSRYARYRNDKDATGGRKLSLKTVEDMIGYYADSDEIKALFLVKLLKLLWYADALSFKRFGHSISGLVYRALPMGAVPVAYELIIDLSAVRSEEIEMGDGVGRKFLPTPGRVYSHLTPEDIEILDTVIDRFGKLTTTQIVETMHREEAYICTAPRDIIPFSRTTSLSLS